MINLIKVHVITYDNREYDRNSTKWEIAEMTSRGVYTEPLGEPTFDFRGEE